MSAPFGRPAAAAVTPADAPGRARSLHRRRSRRVGRASITSGTTRRREANADMWQAPQGVHASCAPTTTHKSADWPATSPVPLAGWTAEELAKLPTYYIMDLDKGMAETVAPEMPTPRRSPPASGSPTASSRSTARSTRARLPGRAAMVSMRAAAGVRIGGAEVVLRAHHRRAVDLHLRPRRLGHLPDAGCARRMQREACTKMLGCTSSKGAGHWVQQGHDDLHVVEPLVGIEAALGGLLAHPGDVARARRCSWRTRTAAGRSRRTPRRGSTASSAGPCTWRRRGCSARCIADVAHLELLARWRA